MADTPTYVLTEPAFFDNVYYKAGDTVTTDLAPGEHMQPVNDTAKSAADRAAQAREWALRHPEAHIGGPSVTGSSLTQEQNAALQAVAQLDTGLTAADVSTLPTPDATPTKAQVKAADKARDDKAAADKDAASDARADAAADAAAGAVKGTLAK